MRMTWKLWAAKTLKDFRETLTRVKNGPSVRLSDTLSTKVTAEAVGLSALRLLLVTGYVLPPMGFSKVRSQANSCCLVPHMHFGCEGGWPQLAWKLWGHNGVVTGGDYDSDKGCQPYKYQPCEHHTQGPLPNCSTWETFKTTECKKNCWNPKYEATYNFDVVNLKKGKKAHMVPRCNAMRHIYEHGPVVAIFSVFEDFLQYKSGVYQHNFGESIGLHAVRVLGWGIENDIPYWLVANSWNDHWGDKGTFKILRGENEANVETGFNAGYPEFVRL
ncbi:hypothetical protein WDU94_011838 [Cyamophila willieti]